MKAGYDLERIKGTLPIEAVLESHGIKVRGHRARCPFCDASERSEALSILVGKFKCFRCQAGGSVIDLVAKLDGLSIGDAIRRCAELAGIGPATGVAITKRPPGSAVGRRWAIAEKFRHVAFARDVLRRIADDEGQPADVRITAIVAARKADAFLDLVIDGGAR